MQKRKIGHGMSTGKIILMGEHAVVYGQPAIAFPFNETNVITTVEKGDALTLNCQYFFGKLTEAPQNLASVKETILNVLETVNHPDDSLVITITSTIPAERGMGSSASVAVATIRALFDYYDYAYTKEELLKWVNYSEKIAHGNPSGIDAAATSGTNPIFFIKDKALDPFSMNLTNTFLVIADTGIKGQTRAAVSDVASLLNKEQQSITKKIDTLGQLTLLAKTAIETNNPTLLGIQMNAAQELLNDLTVSNAQLNHLIQTANHHGALGAKLTGGGRGGCMLALTNSKEQADYLAHELLNAGAISTYIQPLGVTNEWLSEKHEPIQILP